MKSQDKKNAGPQDTTPGTGSDQAATTTTSIASPTLPDAADDALPVIWLLPERIASRITIDPDSGCWLAGPPWDKDGYARFSGQGLHRVVYTLLAGPIPPGLVLDHVKARGCASNACCNPAHLEPVTVRTNILRATSFAAVNARKTRCGACGQPYDLANTYRYKSRRDCRSCIRERVRQYKQRMRAAQQAAELPFLRSAA